MIEQLVIEKRKHESRAGVSENKLPRKKITKIFKLKRALLIFLVQSPHLTDVETGPETGSGLLNVT